ncbi:MAG: RidA family protein [Pseudomonadota bacterium]
MKTIISTSDAPAAIGTYSQAVKISGQVETVYLSGQIPLDPKTMQMVSGFENEVKQVFENLHAVCEAAGGSLNHLVKVNVYLTDLANFAKVNEIMATYFSQPYPARAAIGVASLPRGAQVEIDGVMVIETDGSSGR